MHEGDIYFPILKKQGNKRFMKQPIIGKFKLAVSFVMPAYNCADTVVESVESIIKSNFQAGDELIIVNDGSTDKTAKVLARLKNKYPFIELIDNPENRGCPATRNVGINKAKNPYIFNLDSDDVLTPGSRAFLEDAMISQEADIAAFGEIHYFTENTKFLTHKWICKPGLLALADYLAGHIIPGGNYLYTKKSWEKVGGYSEIGKGLHEFWGFGLKQIAKGSKFFVVPNTFYFHRHGRESLYVRESKKTNASTVANQMIEPFLDLLEEEDALYIQSEAGKNTWFDQLNLHPIRVKNHPRGTTGTIVYCKKSSYRTFLENIRKITPLRLINWIKKRLFPGQRQ